MRLGVVYGCWGGGGGEGGGGGGVKSGRGHRAGPNGVSFLRSEEGRVGKEGRSRWRPDH